MDQHTLELCERLGGCVTRMGDIRVEAGGGYLTPLQEKLWMEEVEVFLGMIVQQLEEAADQ